MKFITKKLIDARHAGRLIPAVTAHSGCEQTPDNSLAHVRAALASGAEFCEVDVHSFDGVLYLTHDRPADFEACATLEDAFRLAQNSAMGFNCDMKQSGAVSLVLSLAARYGMEERILFTGAVGGDDLSALKPSLADWWKNDSVGADSADAIRRLDELGGDYRMLNVYYGDADSPEIFELLAARDYGLSLWTVNEEKDIRRLMKAGAMNITTRCPVLALAIRRELFGI